jgi:hypothetical protein
MTGADLVSNVMPLGDTYKIDAILRNKTCFFFFFMYQMFHLGMDLYNVLSLAFLVCIFCASKC